MRTRILGLVLAVGLLAQGATAGGDVGYGLETEGFTVQEVAANGEAAPMKIVDRAWTTPGVEESIARIAEADVMELEFEFPASVEESRYNEPRFFQDFIWPRTREMFRTNVQPDYFVFGGIILAR